MKDGRGHAVPRAEDKRPLSSGGRYTDDLDSPNQTCAYLLRSPPADARIGAIVDALAPLEIREFAMPATPDPVRRAIQAAT